jgi:hypothetical protein
MALGAISVATIAGEVYLFSKRALGPLRGLVVQMAKFGIVAGLWMVIFMHDQRWQGKTVGVSLMMLGKAVLFAVFR